MAHLQNDFDVIVLGGGSAGTAAASAAAAGGARTLMVNEGELGGLCILRGCMPTKTMLASANAIHETSRLPLLGAKLEGRVVPDFARIMERKNAKVWRFQQAKIRNVEAGDYEVWFGRGRFRPDGALDVDGRRVQGRRYVIASGSEPCSLSIPGIEDVDVLTSDDVMRLSSVPRALVVQGAGPVGLEFAQFFARVGTRVLLVNRSALLSHADPECGIELRRALEEEERLQLAVPGTIRSLRRSDGGLIASYDHPGGMGEFEADALLLAVGRRPALVDLGLEHVGVEIADGRVRHDAFLRTTNPAIYVAGDATGDCQILHLGTQEGTVAGDNAARAEPAARMDYRLKMSVIFTDPPYAQIGNSEVEARQRADGFIVGRARFEETGRAITMDVGHGLWKLFADRENGEILGSSMIGPRADDLIHLVSVMMHYHGSVDDISDLPWYHPTFSEVLIDLARDLERQRT